MKHMMLNIWEADHASDDGGIDLYFCELPRWTEHCWNPWFELVMKMKVIAKNKKRFIDAFGDDKYKELVLDAPNGLLEGVFIGELQVWKCSQKEGRKKCVALFIEDKYKSLTIEAHIHCQKKEKHRFESPSSLKMYPV